MSLKSHIHKLENSLTKSTKETLENGIEIYGIRTKKISIGILLSPTKEITIQIRDNVTYEIEFLERGIEEEVDKMFEKIEKFLQEKGLIFSSH